MKPLLSRRIALLMDTKTFFDKGFRWKSSFIDRASKVDYFHKLKDADKKIILKAEREIKK